MKGMRFVPKGYGGERHSPERVRQDGWREQGLLAVGVDDERLSWPERELVRQLGDKLYGARMSSGSAQQPGSDRAPYSPKSSARSSYDD